MVKKMTIIAVALLTAAALSAQETPKWIRKNNISPDGQAIAFSYKGDIYTVPVAGGQALRLTTHAAYESDPIWTPDGNSIVFTSYREGSRDIFVVDAKGGTPRRITDFPRSEALKAVTPDGKIILSADIQADGVYDGFPGSSQLYITDLNGSAPKLVTSMPVSEISVSKDGKILYEDYKGYEDPMRKHHTSSVTRDIWLYEPSGKSSGLTMDSKGKFTKLSTFEGEDRNPVFAADGDTFYYLSEQNCKNINVFRSSLSNPSKSEQITWYTQNPVRYISVAQNGTVSYSYNGELYVIPEGGKAAKVEISVVRDEDEKEINKLNYTGGLTSFAVSPDEKEIAFVVRGEVFVTSAEYSTTRRITNTAGQERNVSFSKDGRSIYYSAERNGNWGIYKSSLVNKDDKMFTYAVNIKEELFSVPGETSFQPVVSPDGKWVAYLRNRTELVIKSTKGDSAPKSLHKDVNYSYQDGDQRFSWSPDSRYILGTWMANGGWNNADIALIDIESGDITNLTRSGYSDGGFRWALGGKAMTWESDKNGYRSHGSWGAESDVFIMFFDGKALTEFKMNKEDAAIAKMLAGEDKKTKKEDKKDSTENKKPEKLTLDLDNRDTRIYRLTKSSSRLIDHYLSPDGEKLYYIAPLESGNGLLVRDMKEGDIKVLQRGVSGGIQPSPDGKSIYVASGSRISKIALPAGTVKAITFSGEFEFKPKEERAYMFEHIWKQVLEKFYDPQLHGVDWNYYRENYSQFLPHINNYFDFQDMLSEMLGELNGSHTGARYSYRGGETVGHLGVIFDTEWTGKGLKIKEVLPNGVLALADSEIKAGDIIEAIDGEEIESGAAWYRPLTAKAGKRICISVKKGGKKATEIYVTAASTDAGLLYQRWVRQREEMVEKLSGGRVGYVHVEGMDSPSFREVYSKALGKYRHCEALIVDTRHNGGGWLHDDLATFLAGEGYIKFQPRGQYIGTEPYNKWNKPSCVLVCEDNYSDASGFPYTYKTLGLGKIIGTPVPGTMTAVWWEYQINASIVFGIPQVGSWAVKEGRYLENYQLDPDILVYNDPASVLAGQDKQLEAAVEEMLKQINSK